MPWDDPFNDDPINWNDEPPIVAPPPSTNWNDEQPTITPLPGDDGGGALVPPGEGAGPGGPEGPGGDAPGSGGPQFDWGAYDKDPAGYLTKLLGAGGSIVAEIFKALGITKGNTGGLDLSGLLGLGLGGAGAVNNSAAIKEAQQRMDNAVVKAEGTIKDVMGGARANFTPYIDQGKTALAGMAAFPRSDLASQFKATGGGAPSNLAGQFKATGGAAVTLGELARMKAGG